MFFPICFWKSLVLQIVGKFHLCFIRLKMLGERSVIETYNSVNSLSTVCRVFEELINNQVVDNPEKCSLFSDFQYYFTSFRWTVDLLRVIFNNIASNCNIPSVTRTAQLIYQRFLTEFIMLAFFINLNLIKFSVRFLAPFCVVLYGKFS